MSDEQISTLISEAMSLHQQGRVGDAETLYRRVLQEHPEHATAMHFLGLAAHQRGDNDAAETLMRRAAEVEPENPVFLKNFAEMLVGCGRLETAVPVYQRRLALEPADAPSWHRLGQVFSRLGDPEAAAECCRRALSIEPRLMPAVVGLADNLRACQSWEAAEAAYRKAIELSPRDSVLYGKLASMLTDLQRTDEAIAMLDLASGLDDANPAVHHQRGITLAVSGDFDGAEACFRRAIGLAPDFYAAYVQLVTIKKLELDDPAYRNLQHAAATTDLQQDPGGYINIQFSLGRVLQDHADYERAFASFAACKSARRKLMPYSHQAVAASFRAIRQLFDASSIERLRRSGSDSSTPVFIIGMPRSGTTLLEQCLARHPEVRAGGEMVLLHTALRRRLTQRSSAELVAGLRSLDSADYAALAGELAAALEVKAGSHRFITDKLPSNFVLAGLLHVLFPRARIIHCRRNALDTCVSCFTTLFKTGHEFADDLDDLGRYYRLYLDMMGHWRHVLPADRLLELDYEALVTAPEPEIRRMLEFLGLQWHPDCLHFGETSGPVNTASITQVRKPLYQSSIGRWRRYEPQLEHLRAMLDDTTASSG